MNSRAMHRLQAGMPNDPLSLTTTYQMTGILLDWRLLLLNAAGGFTTTLSKATGTGITVQFMVQAVSTTGYVINTSGTDKFTGSVQIGINSATPGGSAQFASSTNKTFTLNGTTTGGAAIGDTIWICDYAAGVWGIWGAVIGSGTLASPFSN